LKEANEKVKELQKKDKQHKIVMRDLTECQGKIDDLKSRYKELEWEHEVKLQ